MFDHIPFFTYEPPMPVTPKLIRSRANINLSLKRFPGEPLKPQALPDNMKHANFLISGKLDAFLRPPLTEFALTHLYHMESFSIFYCDEHFFTDRRDYHSYLILYTYEGAGILEYENKTYHLAPGDGFLIDCTKPHLYRSDGTLWKHSVLHLNGPLLPFFFQQYLFIGSVVFSEPFTGSYQTTLEKLLTIYSSQEPYREWQASDCISTILTGLLLAQGQDTGRNAAVAENLQYLVHYMEHNFSSPLTLDYLAKFSGISKYYLSREFKKYMGFSPNDYLIMLRIEQAKSLLHSTTLPANKIAHMVGIHDLNNFTNLFRRKTGQTPGQYRKTFQTGI